MGTNYYLVKPGKGKCECCGHVDADEELHIGKSSSGWCFSLHVDDDIKSLDDWRAEWNRSGVYIKDEYGNVVSVAAMEQRILYRPHGSERHSIDGQYCIGHGNGTYDLIRGEFS